MITDRWEFDAFLYLFLAIVLWTIIEFCWAYWKDHRRWKSVRPYYGKMYDASTKTYRPNVDLRRTR